MTSGTAPELRDGYVAIASMLRYKYRILVFAFIAAAVSAFIAWHLPNYYTAKISAVPPRKSGGGLDAAISSVSSALRDFGLSKLGGKHGDSYDLIVLLESRQVKDSIIKKYNLAKVYDLPDSAITQVREEFESNLSVNVEVEGNYVVTVDDPSPVRAAAIANDMIDLTNQLSQTLDKRETQVIYKQFEDRLQSTDQDIDIARDSLAKYARQSKMFSPMDQLKVAAQALGELKANVMKQDIILSSMEQTYGKDDPMTIRQRDVLKDMQKKIDDAESNGLLLGNVSLEDAPKAAVPYLHYYAQLEALIKVKAFLIPSFEEVKLDLTKVSPSLYVLDEAQAPQKKSRPKRAIIVLSSFGAAMFLGCVVVLIIFQFRLLRQKIRLAGLTVSSETKTESKE